LFILEIAAALLSVLALRDGISGSAAVSLKTLCALAFWGTLLAISSGLTIRGICRLGVVSSRSPEIAALTSQVP
jgi:hypothetical protein